MQILVETFIIALLGSSLIVKSGQLDITDINVEAAMVAALSRLQERADQENIILDSTIQVASGSNPGTAGELILYFMQEVCSTLSCSEEDIDNFSTFPLNLSLPELTIFDQHCRQEIDCSQVDRRFRTFDGSCNNLVPGRSHYGNINTPIRTFLTPQYSDGISEPRKFGVDGNLLSPARIISERIFPDVAIPSKRVTTLMTFFGQLIAHDYAATSSIQINGEGVDCCNENTSGFDSCDLRIQVSPDDLFYSKYNVTCINFVRSTATVSQDCTFNRRQQKNTISAYIDVSFIYGSTQEEALPLRRKEGGKLFKTTSERTVLLPVKETEECSAEAHNCKFKSGDGRVNENSALAIMHTVFAREHNRVAKVIGRRRPSWDDERIYQEARKIMGGVVQSILYNEFLPLILGPAVMNRYGLNPGNQPNPNLYDNSIDPAVRSGFATAAFRFGHATIPRKFNLLNRDRTLNSKIRIEDTFMAPFQLYDENMFNMISRGLTHQHARITSMFLSRSITEQLFKEPGSEFGGDLAARNIQRGRDHGLPPWNDFREFCRLPRYRFMHDISSLEPSLLGNLRALYNSVDDIDLFVGGLMEEPVPGGVIGPTFACLIGRQFRLFQRGDRYFYTNGATSNTNRGFAYTAAQVRQFNKANLARLFCRHTGISRIQPSPLQDPVGGNSVVSCSDVSRIPIYNIEALIPQN